MKTLIILMSLALISCQKTINAPEKRISAASNSNAIIFDSLVTLDYDGFIANECAGELIHLTGKIHINLKLMLNSNILTETYLINFMDVKGIGEVTGAEYVAAGTIHGIFQNFVGYGETKLVLTDTYRLRYISANTGVVWDNTFHVTTDAYHNAIVSFDRGSVTCY